MDFVGRGLVNGVFCIAKGVLGTGGWMGWEGEGGGEWCIKVGALVAFLEGRGGEGMG